MFYDNLKKLRIEAGLTQSQLAKKLGLSAGSVGMYEQGRRSPDFETTKKIAEFFNITIDALLGKTGLEDSKHIIIKNNLDGFLNEVKDFDSQSQDTITNTLNFLLLILNNYSSDPKALMLILDILNKLFSLSLTYHTSGALSTSNIHKNYKTLFNIHSKYKNDINVLLDKLLELNIDSNKK